MSRIKGLKRRGSDSEDVVRLQDYISEALGPILSNPILDSVILKEVTLVSGNNLIAHKLGRKPIGWILSRKRANVDVWDSQDTVNFPDRFLSIEASGTVTVDIIIF